MQHFFQWKKKSKGKKERGEVGGFQQIVRTHLTGFQEAEDDSVIMRLPN